MKSLKALKVTIEGSRASGKSALAFGIKALLEEHGIGCVLAGEGAQPHVHEYMGKHWHGRLGCRPGDLIVKVVTETTE